jgi:hypothetical protein
MFCCLLPDIYVTGNQDVGGDLNSPIVSKIYFYQSPAIVRQGFPCLGHTHNLDQSADLLYPYRVCDPHLSIFSGCVFKTMLVDFREA